MRRAPLPALAAVLLAAGPGAARAADSLRCDGGLVSVGDTKVDLLGTCGEPALRDARPVVVVVQAAPPAAAAGAVSTVVEEWTYDFGPRRFLQIVTLEGGKVVSVERGGYGYGADRLAEARAGALPRCESSAFSPGLGKLDLLARCGEPTTRDVRREERTVAAGAALVTVELEVWTYDLGPSRFITVATLEDGKVIAVERGGYGYAR